MAKVWILEHTENGEGGEIVNVYTDEALDEAINDFDILAKRYGLFHYGAIKLNADGIYRAAGRVDVVTLTPHTPLTKTAARKARS